jgi:hypothetical protein
MLLAMQRTIRKMVITLLLAAFANCANGITINPIFKGNIRDIPKDGNGDFLYPGIFQHGNIAVYDAEDRGIVEFDLRGLQSVRSAFLFSTEQYNTIDSTVSLSLYGYRGDGIFSLSDFSLGNELFSLQHNVGDLFTVDVTSFVNTAIQAGWDVLGFDLRQDTITRSGIVVYQSVTLQVTPASEGVPVPVASQPSVLAVLSLCLLGLAFARRPNSCSAP